MSTWRMVGCRSIYILLVVCNMLPFSVIDPDFRLLMVESVIYFLKFEVDLYVKNVIKYVRF